MTPQQWAFAAAVGSFTLLAGAYLFQALGYPPCTMCYWQRWPHMAAVGIGVLFFTFGARALAYLGACAAFATSAIGVYHTGVERKWWDGPSSCSGGGGLDGLSGADLLAIDGPVLVMCDQVSWAFLGFSMASWNALFSAILVIMWLIAAKNLPSRG
jgi:disulfide bond formation protein DsbB